MRRTAAGYEIAVTDNGPGIPAVHRDTIFERFRQLGDTMNAKPEGAGLGLAISREIVHQHGGRIWVDDAPGGGSLFVVTIAARAEASTPAPAGREFQPARVT